MIVNFELNKNGFTCLDAPVFANAPTINYLIAKFTIKDDLWSDVDAITAVFKSATYNKVSEVMLDSNKRCYIDPEIYKKGGTIQVKLYGDCYVDDRVVSSTHISEIASFYIKENVIIPTPIPSKYEVFVAELLNAEEAVEEALDDLQTKLDSGYFDGADGADGVGISSVTYNENGTVNILLTNGDTYTSDYSMRGAQGDPGVGIRAIDYGEDGTVIITMTDNTQFVSEYSMKGERGDPGEDGANGVGIVDVVYNADGTLTIYLSDLSEITSEYSMKGEQGDPGQDGEDGADGFSPTIVSSSITGGHRLTITDKNGTQTVDVMNGSDGKGIASVTLNSDYTLTLIYTDGNSTTVGPIKGADGTTPSISIGTVTTLNPGEDATVTRTGTDAAPVFNFGIPKGATGTGIEDLGLSVVNGELCVTYNV